MNTMIRRLEVPLILALCVAMVLGAAAINAAHDELDLATLDAGSPLPQAADERNARWLDSTYDEAVAIYFQAAEIH